MKAFELRYNLFLALIMGMALICGCQTDKKDKEVSVLRVHMESPVINDLTQTISVPRDDPVAVVISKDAVLTESSIIEAKVINSPGGFAIQIQLDENSTWILEEYTASNPGRHFAIYGQWGEKGSDGRWLAAPLIVHRIANGILSFTPDMTREEADRLVLGLNNVAKKNIKGQSK
jgi:preprotein translocase subunit SecD